jgi:hypothetical protein
MITAEIIAVMNEPIIRSFFSLLLNELVFFPVIRKTILEKIPCKKTPPIAKITILNLIAIHSSAVGNGT